MSGRKRIPTPLKIVRGTARQDRTNPREPEPPRGVPKLPADMRPEARAAWKWLAPVLDKMGILTQADAAALRLLCDAYADYRDASEVIREDGTTYETTTPKGDTMYRPRPEVAMRNDAWQRVAKMLGEFGMTAASRSKVSADPMDATDEERFFGAR